MTTNIKRNILSKVKEKGGVPGKYKVEANTIVINGCSDARSEG